MLDLLRWFAVLALSAGVAGFLMLVAYLVLPATIEVAKRKC